MHEVNIHTTRKMVPTTELIPCIFLYVQNTRLRNEQERGGEGGGGGGDRTKSTDLSIYC